MKKVIMFSCILMLKRQLMQLINSFIVSIIDICICYAILHAMG